MDAGIDVPTDGEVRRENYIFYQCRHLHGFDFERLTEKVARDGAFTARLPTITGAVTPRELILARDWRVAQRVTDHPVKITLPGPMTIADSVVNKFYPDPRAQGQALAEALNAEVHDLAAAGCRRIQVDEPVFARKPRQALEYGIEHLERVFHGVPEHVQRIGRDGGAVNDALGRAEERGPVDAERFGEQLQPGEHADGLILWGRGGLGGRDPPAVVDGDEIRERTPDVDSDAVATHCGQGLKPMDPCVRGNDCAVAAVAS